MALILVTSATSEPVTLAEVKSHLNITTTSDDTLINLYITAARLQVENFTKRQLLPATFKRVMRDFPGSTGHIELPRAPLSTVATNVQVTYVNSTVAGSSSTSLNATSFHVDFESTPGRIYPIYEGEWPTDALDVPHSLSIQYVSGYANSSFVPDEIKHWIKMRVGEMYEEREPITTDRLINVDRRAFDGLLDQYMVEDFTRIE